MPFAGAATLWVAEMQASNTQNRTVFIGLIWFYDQVFCSW